MKMLARDGQGSCTLQWEICRFKELKAFVAYTRRTALVFSFVKNDLIAWTAASMSAILLAYSCFESAVSWKSPLVTNRTDLAIILLGVSQIPMALTLGHLLRAIRWHSKRGDMPLGCTNVLQLCLAMRAMTWHTSLEAD